MAVKLCGLSVMEPKLFSEPHTAFTGYDRRLQERQIENWGRGVILVRRRCEGERDLMAESIRLVNSIYSVQDCQEAESEEVCVCVWWWGVHVCRCIHVYVKVLLLSPLHGQPKFSLALPPFILKPPPPHCHCPRRPSSPVFKNSVPLAHGLNIK